ncbi:helix-turn-helix domain-containing protein [Oleiharenicola lentus]|uniref:helix-turn-helix domain-containing protein n=1 Tax=Oleiharenicola lentus TaxID=2508720 RepID=UPI003F6796E6
MQTIGEKLEEARKRKGISIREAAETTKIRGDYLQKFEANTFDIDLPSLYLKGFVRSYAKFLELDAERIVGELSSILAEGKPSRRDRDTREVYARVDFGEAARSSEASDGPSVSRGGSNSANQAAMIKLGLIGGGVVVGVIVILLLVKVLFGGSSSAPKNSATTTPTTSENVQDRQATFTVTAIESTRVKVAYSDGSTVFLDGKYSLNRGDTRPIRYSKELTVTVENPERIRIELNGEAVQVPTNKPMGQFRVPYKAP